MPIHNKVWLGGVIAVLLLAVVVPWQVNGRPAGYRPIFVPPDGSAHIDLTRLLIPVAALVMVTAVGMYLTRNTRKNGFAPPPSEQTRAVETNIVPTEPQLPSVIQPTAQEPLPAAINSPEQGIQPKLTFFSERLWAFICISIGLLAVTALVVWGIPKRPPRVSLNPGMPQGARITFQVFMI